MGEISNVQKDKLKRLLRGRALLWNQKIESLADFVSMISGTLRSDDTYWYRGQVDISWALIPSALRDSDPQVLEKSVRLFREFQRIAEAKLDRPPADADFLKWLQLAQHYRIPSCLLDWTESPLAALYFACLQSTTIGGVYLIRSTFLPKPSVEEINSRIKLDLEKTEKIGRKRSKNIVTKGRIKADRVLGIHPVWNSERLVAQRGMFTLHGLNSRELKDSKMKELQVIPILPEHKQMILKELQAIGVDDFSLFPEMDKMTEYLKRRNEII
jgi:hypothetical protein